VQDGLDVVLLRDSCDQVLIGTVAFHEGKKPFFSTLRPGVDPESGAYSPSCAPPKNDSLRSSVWRPSSRPLRNTASGTNDGTLTRQNSDHLRDRPETPANHQLGAGAGCRVTEPRQLPGFLFGLAGCR